MSRGHAVLDDPWYHNQLLHLLRESPRRTVGDLVVLLKISIPTVRNLLAVHVRDGTVAFEPDRSRQARLNSLPPNVFWATGKPPPEAKKPEAVQDPEIEARPPMPFPVRCTPYAPTGTRPEHAGIIQCLRIQGRR